MKRLVSVLVSLVLMVSCFSSALAAEDFTLRSGIKFGDTLEDILAKEKTLTRDSDDDDYEGKKSYRFEGKIAGYSDADCKFSFDDDGKLIDMEYLFDSDTRDEMSDVYKKLYDSLKRQYGTPLGNTGGSLYSFTGSTFDSLFAALVVGQYSGWKVDYVDYDEWVVDCDGYHVKIDMVSYYTIAEYLKSYKVVLSYHYFTNEEFIAKVQEKEAERQEVDGDL